MRSYAFLRRLRALSLIVVGVLRLLSLVGLFFVVWYHSFAGIVLIGFVLIGLRLVSRVLHRSPRGESPRS